MIIPQITDFLPRQPPPEIPPAPSTKPILSCQTQHKTHQQHRRHHQQTQTNRKALSIKRRLLSWENEARNNTAGTAQTNLQSRRNRNFILSTYVIRHDGPQERKADVRAHFYEIERQVPNALVYISLNEQDDETDGREQVAGLCECEAVTEAIGEVGCCKGPEGGGEEDGDDQDLNVAGRGVRVECLDEGGAEEVDGVGRCASADVDWDAGSIFRNWVVCVDWTDRCMDGWNGMEWRGG